MLILAGVSLNAIVGDNGIITMAMKAKEQYEFAAICEELETMMFEFNTTGETGSSSLKTYMNKQVENGKIDSFKTVRKDNSMNFVIEKDGHMFYAVPDGDGYWKVVSTEEGTTELTELAIEVYTTSNVNANGTFELGQSGKETDVVFYEGIDDDLNFEIKQGTVNIYIYDDMYLSNEGVTPARSAIDIHEGATLNLYLEEEAKMTVDSGTGATAPVNEGSGSIGGAGGYAGIHVPSTTTYDNNGVATTKYATLNVYGDGTLIAIGGDAGDGGTAVSGNAGGRRRSEEQELVLEEMDGQGGNSNTRTSLLRDSNGGDITQSGTDGLPGENCGYINFYNDLEVYAYGGAGGSGGVYSVQTGSSGTGGGGYPGSGIGRWSELAGGGADHANGGAGYTGGMSESGTSPMQSFNGINYFGETYPCFCPGTSYFSSTVGKARNGKWFENAIGGQGGSGIEGTWFHTDSGGDGGVAGQGGTINVSRYARVYAYNGDMITSNNPSDYNQTYKSRNADGSEIDGTALEKVIKKDLNSTTIIPTEIYAQAGILRSIYKSNQWWDAKLNKNYTYFSRLLGNRLTTVTSTITAATDYTTVANYEIRQEYIEPEDVFAVKSGYSNPDTGSVYGVGSGAGYIEVSNGTYTIDTTGRMD